MQAITNHYTGNRKNLSAAALAADYKARGIERSRAWSQFVIDRALNPGIDAKDFYAYYDSVVPKLLVDEVETAKVPYVDPEFADYGKRVRVGIKVGRHLDEREGTIVRTLQGMGGDPVYEVDFGDGPTRLRASDSVELIQLVAVPQ